MTAGISFVDIFVSEITMVVFALVFVISAVLLVFMKKHLTRMWTKAAVLALVVTGLYLVFIVWLVLMWG